MEIVHAQETGLSEHDRKVKAAFLNRRVVSCGHVSFPAHCVAHEGEKHMHEHDEVFVVLTGAISVPGIGAARAGDWILVKAGEEHHLTNHTDLPCTVIFLILKPEH